MPRVPIRGVSTEFLSETDEKPFRPSDVAEPVDSLVLDHLSAYEIRAEVNQAIERVVDVVNCEHHSEVAQGVHWRVSVISDHLRRKETREFEPAVAIWRAHHGDLNALVTQAGNTSCPFALNQGLAFDLEAELAEELDCRCQVLNDDANVVHPEGHLASLRMRPERHLRRGRGSSRRWRTAKRGTPRHGVGRGIRVAYPRAFGAILQEHATDYVHLPELHGPTSLPALVGRTVNPSRMTASTASFRCSIFVSSTSTRPPPSGCDQPRSVGPRRQASTGTLSSITRNGVKAHPERKSPASPGTTQLERAHGRI